ncbi:Com family DNA-binding transcriptional regulator [Bordetella petrii]|uniref:Com family DNA-binding transcriptional regulator n=1 Tax=Bordetella petrii TaxID=94624 RepID=UPI0009D93D68|nr:Com family DNA-binding transcriptional regulator [Bordetella petrii]
MQDIRCGHCRRKLAEGIYLRLAIKCPRCGTMNFMSAEGACQPERHGASHQKETLREAQATSDL